MTGQSINMDTMSLRWGHFRVLIIASMGQIIGAGLATLVGIILPMIQMLRHPELTSLQQGLIGCTSLIGITIGSLIFGRLSDKYGYLFFFRLCPLIVLGASLLAYFTSDLLWLVVGLFLMGLGIGGGYSLDSDYISEIMPKRWRLFMVGVAKASSSLGNILVALICFFLLKDWQNPELWNRLLLIIAVFALFMILTRIRFAQSPGWLMAHGRPADAESAVRYFLGKDVEVIEKGQTEGKEIHHHIGSDLEVGEIRNRPKKKDVPKVSWGNLFHGKNLKRVIFSGIPWACEGLGVYGIGVFLPILVMALGLESSSSSVAANGIHRITNSLEITTWINFFILPGFALGLFLVNRWYHVRIQVWGFILCAIGLIVLLVAYKYHMPIWIAIAGFMMFELFLNAGPHLMTFIIPSQIYPVTDRGEGAGLAAAIGKVGAVLGVLFIPMLLSWGGAELVLLVSIVVQVIGAVVTGVFGKEVLPDNKNHHTEVK
ncbi:MFS transporter [Bacteroides sp.]|uniref:MFS transporter n=1 Tax=Bacteroides sp. TaxID=29523 RepID=UPI0026145F32|nr:MFS transporter [Bacteroides sp.]MDD3037564.1 MFS transporter [Bacteroides sp.]